MQQIFPIATALAQVVSGKIGCKIILDYFSACVAEPQQMYTERVYFTWTCRVYTTLHAYYTLYYIKLTIRLTTLVLVACTKHDKAFSLPFSRHYR